MLTDKIAVGFQAAPNTARSYYVGDTKVLEACVFILRPENVVGSFALAFVWMSWALHPERSVCRVINLIGYLLCFFVLCAVARVWRLVAVLYWRAVFQCGSFALFGESHGIGPGRGEDFWVAVSVRWGHQIISVRSVRLLLGSTTD
jgi:hypothetical protein